VSFANLTLLFFSNMEFTVNSAVNASEEVAAANGYPNIRVFSGPEQNVDTLNTPGVFNLTHDTLLYTRLNWSVATNQSIGCVDKSCHGWDYFSAVCWFAIRDLHDMLGGKVPVGGISQVSDVLCLCSACCALALSAFAIFALCTAWMLKLA
jgi:hypothetical protein